jgi:guanylate kinase
MATGKIFVFSAPSGAGKTTLLDHVRATIPNLIYSISVTTRQPRPGEVNGVHYYFITEKEFKRRVQLGEFAEWQMVHTHFYGTPKAPVDTAIGKGLHVVMDIDVYGKKKFDVFYPDAIGILILPPSIDILQRRLTDRGTDSSETIALRMDNARIEMEFARSQGKYEYTVINDNLEIAKRRVVDILRACIQSG